MIKTVLGAFATQNEHHKHGSVTEPGAVNQGQPSPLWPKWNSMLQWHSVVIQQMWRHSCSTYIEHRLCVLDATGQGRFSQ